MLALTKHTRTSFLILLLTPLACVGQEGVVSISVKNADELIASVPDTQLARDVLTALDDFWLKTEQDRFAVEASDRVALLIQLAAPHESNTVSFFNGVFRINKVTDFAEFVESIDYARVVAQDEKRWRVQLEIDPEEVQSKRLVERSDSTGRNPIQLRKIREEIGESVGFDRASGFGESLGSIQSQSLSRRSERQNEDRHKLDGGIESFEPGQWVEVDIAGEPYCAQVLGPGKDDDLLEISIDDLKKITKAIRNRSLAKRLRSAGGLTLNAPADRLRRIRYDPSDEFKQLRTWLDNTGKHKIEASFIDLAENKVTLAKPDGKEIKVPLNRLSEPDRDFARQAQRAETKSLESTNPFEQVAAQKEKDLRPDFSRMKGVKGGRFSHWSFDPQEYAVGRPNAIDANSVSIDSPGKASGLGPEISRIFVSPEGANAIVIVEAGNVIDDQVYAQRIDFLNQELGLLVELPLNSKVLDALPEEGLLLIKSRKIGAGTTDRLYLHRLEGERSTPVLRFPPFTKDDFHKSLKEAYFLSQGRVITKSLGGPAIIWDLQNATALHLIPLKNNDEIGIGPSRRLVTIGSRDRVEVIDSRTGKHVATLEHGLGHTHGVAFQPSMRQIAVWGERGILTWDLYDGEIVCALKGRGYGSNRTIEWVDDFLLMGGRYLYDPFRYTLLWEYAGREGYSLNSVVKGGRYWYAPDRDGLYLGSIPAPHDSLAEVDRTLGNEEELTILRSGDSIHLKVDTEQEEDRKRLLEGLTSNLIQAGYKVADTPIDDDSFVLEAIFKKLPEQEIRISKTRNPFPTRKDIVTKKITPHVSAIIIRQGEKLIWGNNWWARPGHVIFLNPDESLDQALVRLTKPNRDRILQESIPESFTRPGDVGPSNSYGYSRLGERGIVDEKISPY